MASIMKKDNNRSLLQALQDDLLIKHDACPESSRKEHEIFTLAFSFVTL